MESSITRRVGDVKGPWFAQLFPGRHGSSPASMIGLVRGPSGYMHW